VHELDVDIADVSPPKRSAAAAFEHPLQLGVKTVSDALEKVLPS
jgi:hypothetical protein